MAVRKLENKEQLEIEAKATVAITGNPTAPGIGGGLFVKLDTDTNYFVLAGVGDEAIGIVDSNVLINGSGLIKMSGIRLIRLGGTVAALDYVEVGANGKAVLATGLRPVMGQVIQAGVSGDFVSIIFGKKPRGAIKGADVASAATIVPTGEMFHLTGTTTVTAITMTGALAGKRLLLIADGSVTVTLTHMVGGTFAMAASNTLELGYDGSTLYEVGRNNNA